MAVFPIHSYFVFNGELKPVSFFVVSENEGGIYEVIRVLNKVPLFFQEHLERFYASAKIAGKVINFSPKEINLFVKALIDSNNVTEGNILISCKSNLKAFFIPHKYPENSQYKYGIHCGSLKAERENPNAKVFQTQVRQQSNRMITEKGYYEILLVDYLGRITEGSRSNVFFVKEDQIITPPATKVLLGITRQKTILCAKEAGFKVIEKDVLFEDLNSFQSAFITGTSPKILPVNKIGDIFFDSNNRLVQTLIYQYNLLIEEYMKKRLYR